MNFLVYKTKLHTLLRFVLMLPPMLCVIFAVHFNIPFLWIPAILLLIVVLYCFLYTLCKIRIDTDGIICSFFSHPICVVRWKKLKCAGIERVQTAYGEMEFLYFSECPMPKRFSWSINRNYAFVSIQPGLISCLEEKWDKKKVSHYFKDTHNNDCSLNRNAIFSLTRLRVLMGFQAVALIISLALCVISFDTGWIIATGLFFLGLIATGAEVHKQKKARFR